MIKRVMKNRETERKIRRIYVYAPGVAYALQNSSA